MSWAPPHPPHVAQAGVGPAAGAEPAPTDVLGAAHDAMFGAMGTFCHVIVVGPPGLLDAARRRIEHLEQRWSRFLPDSDLSRVNAAGGAPVAVSAEAFLLVSRAVEGWRLTGGLYDPTVLRAVVAAGYDRSFSDPACSVHRPDEEVGAGTPAPGAGGIRLDPRLRTVQSPPGVLLDPGGIGKGLAADVVVAELMADGASGACVNVGGDLRVAGRAPTEHGWVTGVEDPVRRGQVVPMRLHDEAVVTSTRLIRQWHKGGRAMHHIIDPRTGEPSTSRVHTATVVAAQGWWAEVLAKALLVADMPAAGPLAARAGVAALVACEDVGCYELGGWADRVVEPDGRGG